MKHIFPTFATLSVLLLAGLTVYVTANKAWTIRDNRKEYKILFDRNISFTNSYTEKDGCILFDDIKICGNYAIVNNK